jgi:deoxyribonuclease-4
MGEKPRGPLLGAHMSIAGGVDRALIMGQKVGCDIVQIFTKSSRQWFSKPYRDDEVVAFRETLAGSGIREVIAHDSYLLNLGSPDSQLRQKSVKAFLDEMERCELLGVRSLIAHPGSHVGSGEEQGLKTIAGCLNEIHAAARGLRVRIALEITAGQGSNLGYRFEQMREIVDQVHESDRIRFCFDTEHAFAAGYDIRTREGCDRTFSEFDEILGIDRIVAFHLNDSKKDLNCRVDRHEQIGRGKIGVECFRFLVNDERFWGIPMSLETPKGPDCKEDVENLSLLRSLISAS